eukprot:37108_1
MSVWISRLKLVAICFLCRTFTILTYKAPDCNDDTIFNDTKHERNVKYGDIADKKRRYIIFALFLEILLYSRYYKYKYLKTSGKQQVLRLHEKIGFTLSICGFLFRLYSRYTLGKHFTYILSVQPQHKIINYGPYSIVRHPGYTGSPFLYQLGCSMWSKSKLFIMVSIIKIGFVIKRIENEEKLLCDNVGEGDYQKYQKQVPYKLIPFIF